MNIEQEIENDLGLDVTNLVGESANNPILVFKYQRKAKVTRHAVAVLEQQLKQVEKNQFLYYIGKHPDTICPEIYEKSELKYIMAGDSKILKVNAHLTIKKLELELLDDAIKCFIARGFAIKNVIDTKKIELGIN